MIESRTSVFKQIPIYALIAFFVMSSFYLIFGNFELNFYDITQVNITNFYYQIAITIGLLIILIVIHKRIQRIDLYGIFAMSFLLFLTIFILLAPAFSITIGAIILTIPLFYYTLTQIEKNRLNKANLYIYIINIVFVSAIILIFLFKLGYDYPIYTGRNISMVSHDQIIPDNQKMLLIASFISVFVLIFFLFLNKEKRNSSKGKKIAIKVILILTLLEVTLLSVVMVYRTLTLNSPGFDFGIFTQMFYNMKNFNGMMTTIERSTLLSHNAVHVSPIYYLLLPFFMIFPFPETLQVLQAVVVGLGVIPIYLIAKHFKLNYKVTIVVSALYLFNPAIISSSYYDLHENCFLAPLILFVIYFALKQKWIKLLIAFILTLMVKEDAGIYLLFIGVYFFFVNLKNENRKEKRNYFIMSILMMIFSVSYFLLITKLLNSQGDGAMFWRYDNLNGYPDKGILGLVISVIQSPSYLLTTMFSPNKIYHLIIIFASLGLIPLLNKELNNYWLFIPLIIINFSTTYPYQHQFGFQYYFGTMALIIFVVMLVFKENIENQETIDIPIKKTSGGKFKNIVFLTSVMVLMAVGIGTIGVRAGIVKYYYQSEDIYKTMRKTLIEIPRDKKVLATSFLTPYLSDREILYEYSNRNLHQDEIIFDYILIDKRATEERLTELTNTIESSGYILSDESTDYILIFIPQ